MLRQNVDLPKQEERQICFKCPHCNSLLKAPLSMKGKEAICPDKDCCQKIVIPEKTRIENGFVIV